MNRYVVLARFDKNTEEKLIALRREMTNAGYASSEWPPHITLAAYEDLDAEALCDWTGEFVREHTRQKLTFGSVSLLPPYATHRETAVLCLNPVHAKPFVDFYYAFHEKYESFCKGIGSLSAVSEDKPVIHCTLSVVRVTELQDALELVFQNDVFTQAEVTALEIYTYPMRLIKRFELTRA